MAALTSRWRGALCFSCNYWDEHRSQPEEAEPFQMWITEKVNGERVRRLSRIHPTEWPSQIAWQTNRKWPRFVVYFHFYVARARLDGRAFGLWQRWRRRELTLSVEICAKNKIKETRPASCWTCEVKRSTSVTRLTGHLLDVGPPRRRETGPRKQ